MELECSATAINIYFKPELFNIEKPGTSVEVYEYLEPLLSDFRQFASHGNPRWSALEEDLDQINKEELGVRVQDRADADFHDFESHQR